MSKIKLLSVHEAQKIAAGEVIERPSHIVKELIENSLDAGATYITLLIEDGGKQLIRVIDNGCGMDAEDAQLCFERHATSKITCLDDLQIISTFGFRGEALASIAAVSKVTLITKQSEMVECCKLECVEGRVSSQSVVAGNTGTDIAVRDLFFAIPARKKFLKTHETELRQIVQLFFAYCLLYTHIHFVLVSDDKQLYNCPPVDERSMRYTQLYDYRTAQAMIALQTDTNSAVEVTGVIARHECTRYDRNGIFLFVNNRWIKNQSLVRSIMNGYLNVLPPGKFPFACITISIDPKEVDINIHPRKEEVKFMHPRIIEQHIERSVKKTLEQQLSAHIKRPVTLAPRQEISPNTFTQQPTMPLFFRDHIEQVASVLPAMSMQHQPSEMSQDIKTNFVTYDNVTTYRLIGQLHKTYLLLEHDNGLFIIDQHAAHERVLYELFAKRFEQTSIVQLLFPPIINLTVDEMSVIIQYMDIFESYGIVIEPFGQQRLIVRATPVYLKHLSYDELIKQVAQWIHENELLDQVPIAKIIHEKLRAQMACKAAVKAGDELTQVAMEQLLRDLNAADNRFTCPHGRPTSWLVSLYDIEKKFKRKI